MKFIDLERQKEILGKGLTEAVNKVIEQGNYIMGPEVTLLEKKLAEYCEVKYALSCSSGTDALLLPLMALGIGKGDAIIVPSFTFVATAEVVSLTGATPIFCDVYKDTFNIDLESAKECINLAKSLGLDCRGIIPVDLFGLAADYDPLILLAEKEGMFILEDCAQGFGAVYKEKKAGSFGIAAATSFYPAKPLGCYGDGGAVFTDDEQLFEKMYSLRVHGQGVDKYENINIGLNARLDTIQAAILLEKLKIFDEELTSRNKVAQMYTEELSSLVKVPTIPDGLKSSWAQYTILLDDMDREEFRISLSSKDIPTAIYYPIPLNKQKGYEKYPSPSPLLKTEELSRNVVSLPMHPYLTEQEQEIIIHAIASIM